MFPEWILVRRVRKNQVWVEKRKMGLENTYIKTTKRNVKLAVAVNRWGDRSCCRKANGHFGTIIICIIGLGCCGDFLEIWVA